VKRSAHGCILGGRVGFVVNPAGTIRRKPATVIRDGLSSDETLRRRKALKGLLVFELEQQRRYRRLRFTKLGGDIVQILARD
jgi:hypothetical protein